MAAEHTQAGDPVPGTRFSIGGALDPAVQSQTFWPGVSHLSAAHQEALKQRPGDQPLPVVNEHPDIQSQVIADIEARRQVGIQRYGTALQPHNGRDALQDAYEEAIDLAMYLKQLIVERST